MENLLKATHIVSFSGGKDSTAMLHMMLDRGMQVDAVMFFDTPWEFPQTLDHVSEVEKKTGITITRVQPEKSFDYTMFETPITAKNDDPARGKTRGCVYARGRGWPSKMRRWCTGEKQYAIRKYIRGAVNPIMYIGFAADEMERMKTNPPIPERYPLIEWNITEHEAMEYCHRLGYTFGGLHDHFARTSCFCCPLQPIASLYKIWKYFPDLWQRIEEMDASRPSHCPGFRGNDSARELAERFAFEDRLRGIGIPEDLSKRWSAKWRQCCKAS